MFSNKVKIDKPLISMMFCFTFISLISIYSAGSLVNDMSLFFKQVIWYIIGYITIFIVMIIGNDFFIKNSFYFYVLGNILLILLLFFGTPINESKCWFIIKGIGSFQPSEFMKIVLILYLSKIINSFKIKYPIPTFKEEAKLILKVLLIVGIPSILTFLEPDTGVVLIYIIITLIMLFISGVRIRWFIILFIIAFFLITFILISYFFMRELFIKILGTSFFLRVDRLLDWSNKNGFQLERGLYSIGSSGLLGYGFLKTPIYFPEAETDFIFAIFSSNFGFIGSLLLITLIIFFDLKLIATLQKTNNNIYKYIISGISAMIIYQQFQNIGMTIGILPITGITLPFISYGGSSLISYMIMIGILFNITNENLRFKNK